MTHPRPRLRTRTLLASVALAAGGCGESSGDPPSSAPENVTWSEHVAPLVYEHCAGCHREGAIAPFALTSYAETAEAAALVAHVTETRQMPPMGMDNSGDCNTFRDARWLTDDEIALFAAWAEAGAPEGDPALAPPVPPPTPGLARVDATLEMPVIYTPPVEPSDDYRCFVVELGEAAGRWLTGYEVVPGEPRVVHHVIAYSLPNAAAAASAQQLDAREEGPGYTCYGASGVAGSNPVALWAPGTGPVEFPGGTGVRLEGTQLIVQVHYNVAGGTLPDRTAIRLELADSVTTPGQFVLVPNFGISLPPREPRVETSTSFRVPLDSTVWGAIPHMHELGRELRASVSGEGGDRCLVDVFDWDFQWQGLWFYDEPFQFQAGERVNLTCVYDTRSRSDMTYWGEGTSDEMCLVYLFVSL